MSRLAPVHPGEIIKEDYLAPLSMSAHKLAMELHLPASRINAIVNCERSITAETALRLGRFFNTSAQYWMNLQTQYDLAIAEDELADAVKAEVRQLQAT